MELMRGGSSSVYGLDNNSSLDLLRTSNIGRVAVNGEKCPSIFPAQYAVDGEAIVFKASSQVSAEIGQGAAVTFQADGYEYERGASWSVVAQGIVEQMRDPGAIEVPIGFFAPEPERWATAENSHWVRVVPQHLVGVLSTGGIIDIT